MPTKKWKDKGYKGSRFGTATPFLDSGHEHRVENVETGEERTIQVYSDQTLGDAIKAGNQWTEADERKNEQTRHDAAENAARINAESDQSSGKKRSAAQERDFTDEEIVDILHEAARDETTIRDLCRSHGLSESRFYKWRRKYGGMSSEQVKQMRNLKAENVRLKHELAKRENEMQKLRKS